MIYAHGNSSFDFEIPVRAPILRIVAKRPAILHGAASSERDAAGRLQKARFKVLVVDDEDLFREGLVFKLRNLYHASVEEAETGWIALEKVSAGRAFDLILMDISLPDIDGDEVYEAMRARDVGTTIVLMSAYEENQAIAQALGVPFLEKPLDDAALQKILQECGGEEVS